MSTPEQRAQWDYDDRTAGIYRDVSLDERLEVEDDAFRHWDTLTFAHAAPLTGRWDGSAKRPAATTSSIGGGPKLVQPDHRDTPLGPVPAGSEAGGTNPPPRIPRPRTSSWEVHAFSPTPLTTDALEAHRLSSVESVFDSDAQTLSQWRHGA